MPALHQLKRQAPLDAELEEDLTCDQWGESANWQPDFSPTISYVQPNDSAFGQGGCQREQGGQWYQGVCPVFDD